MLRDVSWLDDCINRAYISQHYEDWDKRIFENYDVNEMIETLDRADPDFLLITARTHNGQWFTQVGWGEMHRGLQGTDELDAFITRFHARGKRVVAYISAVYDAELFNLHPDWRQVDRNGNTVMGGENRSWGKVVCPNSPYREHIIAMTESLVRTHEVDGVFYDMTFFDEEPCYCEFCKRRYRALYGVDLPAKDWSSPAYRRMVEFRIESNYTFIKDLCDTVKRWRPEAATGIQYQLLNNARSLMGQSIKAGRIPDYLYFDPYIDGGFLRASVCTRLLSKISAHLPEVSIVTRPGSHNDNPQMKPLDHLRTDAFSAIANGGAIQLFDVMWSNGKLQEAMWERNGQVYREVDARKPWLGGEELRSVALYYSENSRYWYGMDDVLERYDRWFLGFARVLMEEHIPFSPILELTQEALKGYQVLVLSNAACLSEAEARAVREFVSAGGGLVCTGKTSLYDERGERRGNFLLADVIGADFCGDTSAYQRVYYRFDTARPPARRIPEDGLITNWGEMQKLSPRPGSRALASITYPYTETTGTRYINIMVNPPAVHTEVPCCVGNRFGEGKVLYFAGETEKNYLAYSFPELKWLLADAVRAVTRDPLRIELTAPGSVEMTAYLRNSQRQLVCHLLNYQPEAGRTAMDPGYESRHLIQEILPVYRLKISIQAQGTVKSVTLQPVNEKIPYTLENGRIEAEIPKLECHAMLVVDYQ